MTNEQKYNALLRELGELLESKNTMLNCQKWQIDQLKEKLKAAEEDRDMARDELEVATGRLENALDAIARLKGGAE